MVDHFGVSAFVSRMSAACNCWARPGVNWRTPSAVQTRYDGMGWYVSALIYDATSTSAQWGIKSTNTLLFSTNTEAMMSSGSPIRPRAGILRWSSYMIIKRRDIAKGWQLSLPWTCIHPSCNCFAPFSHMSSRFSDNADCIVLCNRVTNFAAKFGCQPWKLRL